MRPAKDSLIQPYTDNINEKQKPKEKEATLTRVLRFFSSHLRN